MRLALDQVEFYRKLCSPYREHAVRILLEVRTDRLALKFHETKDLKVRDEIYRLCRELMKLDEPWKFVAI
jgi:hypothetical protein